MPSGGTTAVAADADADRVHARVAPDVAQPMLLLLTWPKCRHCLGGPFRASLGVQSGLAEQGDGGACGNGAKSDFPSSNGEIVGCLGRMKTIFIDENSMFGEN